MKGSLASAVTDPKTEPRNYNGPICYMLGMILSYGLVKATKEKKLKSWFEAVLSGKDVIGAPRDRLPFLGAIIDTLMFMRYAIKKRISLAEATTVDIEWNGEDLA